MAASQPAPVVTGSIPPPATLGMLGGGQLVRFCVGAAHELGYDVWVLDPDADSPAGRIADEHLVAAYDDPAALDRLVSGCQAVTTEFENVPAGSLERLARSVSSGFARRHLGVSGTSEDSIGPRR